MNVDTIINSSILFILLLAILVALLLNLDKKKKPK